VGSRIFWGKRGPAAQATSLTEFTATPRKERRQHDEGTVSASQKEGVGRKKRGGVG